MNNLLVLIVIVCVLFPMDCLPINKPASDNAEKITYSLPRQMVFADNVTLSGYTKPDRKKVTFGLVKGVDGKPDYGNVPCQINLYFPNEDSTRNTATVNSIVNAAATKELDSGYEVTYLLEGLSLDISFETFLECDVKKIQPRIAGFATQYLCDWTEDIQFVSIGGDVHKIDTLKFTLG